MEVNIQHPLFTLVHHHHTEKQARVHSQFIQQHVQCSTTVAKILQNPVSDTFASKIKKVT